RARHTGSTARQSARHAARSAGARFADRPGHTQDTRDRVAGVRRSPARVAERLSGAGAVRSGASRRARSDRRSPHHAVARRRLHCPSDSGAGRAEDGVKLDLRRTRDLRLLVAGIMTLACIPCEARGQTPLTLSDAIAKAMDTSHRLTEARARQEGAEATIQVRRTADQPTVTLSGG